MLQRIGKLPLATVLTGLLWASDGTSLSALAQESGRLAWPNRVVDSHRAGEVAPVVTGIAMRPQSAEAAIVGDDHIVHLVDTQNGRLLKTLPGHQDWIRTLAFAPDGQALFTAGSDRRVLKWDLANQRWSIFATEDASIESLAFSPDGTRLAVVGFEPTVRVYDARTGRKLATLKAACADLRAVAFSPDGRHLAVGGRSGELQLWEQSADRWQTVSQTLIHRQRIQAVQFVSDHQIVSIGEDRKVHLLDLVQPQRSGVVATLPSKLYSLTVISPELVACGGSDNRISLIDLQRKQSIGYLDGHRGTVSSLAFAGQTLVSGSYDGETRVWQTQSATAVAFQGHGIGQAPSESLAAPILERTAGQPDSGPPLLPIRSVR